MEAIARSLEEEVRSAFDRPARSRRRLNAGFNELLAMFKDPALSMTDIGQRLQVNPSHATRIYRRYFERLAGRSSKDRYQWARDAAVQERVRNLPREQVMRAVATSAEEAGLTVHRVTGCGRPDRIRSRNLRVQGHLCKVHELRFARRPHEKCKQRYALFKLKAVQKIQYDAHILYIAVPKRRAHILVVPAYVLHRLPVRRGAVTGHIPVENRPVYRNHHRRINWLSYENAWHLLE